MQVVESMTSPALTVTPPTTILAAARLVLERNVTALPVVTEEGALMGIVSRSDLLRHRVKSLPVVDGDRLLGVISVTDILRVKAAGDESIASGVRHRLAAYAGDDGCWDIAVEDGVVRISSSLADEKHRVLRALAETVPGVVRVRTDAAGPVAAHSEARTGTLTVARAG